jgi:hypothetical protein
MKNIKQEQSKVTKKLVGKSLSADELRDELNNTSPLQMSKKLIEYELYDQQSSIEIMDKIYEEFEDGTDVVDSLVTPVFLNICDGLIKHPKLRLSKTGITATRLVNEIKNFHYEDSHSLQRDILQDKINLNENTKKNTQKRNYNRDDFEDKKQMNKYKQDYLSKRNRDEYTNQNKVKDRRPQPDHIVSLKSAVSNYGKSKFLSNKELKEVLNKDSNFAVTNGSLNQSKGAQDNDVAVTNSDTIAGKQSQATKKRMIEKQKQAIKTIENDLNQKVSQNVTKDLKKTLQGNSKLVNDAKEQAIDDSKNKAMGEVVILLIKPIYYEFNDIFQNGITAGFDTESKIDAFMLRMNRVKEYVINNLQGSFMDILKDFLKNFVTMIINGIVNAFVGLLKKVLQIISEGFSSIIEAFKIMMKPTEEMTSAQKADAITKLLATTVITFLGAYFEESILGFMNGTPLEFLKDVIMIMLTGIASTVVVWLLDEADLFSVKDEKRLVRVKEIFALRIENIKNNTDIFKKESIEILAKQKIQFQMISERLSSGIDSNENVNNSIYEMADFMSIDLQVKTTDDFMQMLVKNKNLKI